MQKKPAGGAAVPYQEKIIVLDFGGQYSMLLARRIREAKVYCEVLPYNTPWVQIKRESPAGLILSGEPAGVHPAPRCDPAVFRGDIPVLGICYGMQLLASELGGTVQRGDRSGDSRTCFQIIEHEPLFVDDYFRRQDVYVGWISHPDEVIAVPNGFMVMARTENDAVAAMGDPRRRLYGLQMHPEVSHTAGGMQVLARFLYDVCKCSQDWTPERFVQNSIHSIRAAVGPEERVVCALSGGVDSTVVAFLLDRALGKRFVSIFVDHGLLRQDEARQVCDLFRERLQGEFIHVNARERFLNRLRGVTDPEEKRRIIGAEFIAVFKEEARKSGPIDYLAQGTIYPDVVESGSFPGAAVIKSHHNVGGLPAELGFKLIEPLRQLFKNEVRLAGRELGLPESVLKRQPFPGPGMAVRVIGEVTAEKVAELQAADAILQEEIMAAGLNDELWQFFAVHTGIKAVGMKGGSRHYGTVIALRAVTSQDAMIADWARLPYELLERISARIISEVPSVSRVVYDITAKPPGTIEWE